ncbi:MAG TPA: HAMP domain-containing sensor histidine kinase, partial [Anaerolinea sp.]|nr:HAMP domain-containing sensor histidine kinase [Anaerolinea sp.]
GGGGGATIFSKGAAGPPPPPPRGTGPGGAAKQHRLARQSVQGSVRTIPTGGAGRMAYLTTILTPQGEVLGTVEASLPLDGIQDQLDALRGWLTLIIALASALAVPLALGVSGVLLQPLKGLVHTAEQVRQGDLHTRARLRQVTEIDRLAETLNGMLDRIGDDIRQKTEMVESMRRFAADASHELRSPLAVFRSSVDMLKKAGAQGDPAAAGHILDMLHREVDAMTVLVENLLLLARLDPSNDSPAVLFLEPVDPLPLLEEVYERAKVLTKGQNLRLCWPNQPLPPVLADREMLRRALNNLVENAIAHTPAGKEISLLAEVAGPACSFIVQDQGEGIPAEQQARVFERFYRGDQARSRQIPGTGLGLAIVAAIVAAHHGQVGVTSQENAGTRFRMDLPLAEALLDEA